MDRKEQSKIMRRVEQRYFHTKWRCTKPENKDFKSYGGRGIKLEFSLSEYKNFIFAELKRLGVDCNDYESVKNGLDRFAVDRIDSTSNYRLDNCILQDREMNEFIQKVEVSHLCFTPELFIPVWVFDKVGGLRRKASIEKIKERMRFCSEFSFNRQKLVLNYIWFDFSQPPLKVEGGKVVCPECMRKIKAQRVLECKCGFHSIAPNVVKKKQEREEVNQALSIVEDVITTPHFNTSLTPKQQEAEQRLRLECIKKYGSYRKEDREFSLEEVAFVLDITKEAVRQIENSAIEKMRKLGIEI